jgi:Ca2+-transporting ATPase
MVFATLAMDSLLFAFSCKNLRKSLWEIDLLSNPMLNISFLLGVGLLIAAIYAPPLQSVLQTVPLELNNWFILIGLSLTDVLTLEIVKYIFIKNHYSGI